MKLISQRSIELAGKAIVAIVLLVPIIIYNTPFFSRPPLTNETRSLFQGISYKREVRSLPHPVMLHLVNIDLTEPGIGVFVTPGTQQSDKMETNARTASQFLEEFKLQLAINANFFYPFEENAPWDYFPKNGDRVNNVGQAISNGKVYSESNSKFPVLCFAANNRARIIASGACPKGTQQGVAGNKILIQNGKATTIDKYNSQDLKNYSRVVAALDKKGEKLWLLLVDGKQRFYSEGLKASEVQEILLNLGVDIALNLDGGGSTTLAIATPAGAKVLNAPFQNKIPMQERPIANHLGFSANN